jgi:hypothetical protein
MPRPLRKNEARALRDQCYRLNQREEEELRSTSMEIKLQQFNTLLAWAYQFGWARAFGAGEGEVRERWARLRKAHLEKCLLHQTPKKTPKRKPK